MNTNTKPKPLTLAITALLSGNHLLETFADDNSHPITANLGVVSNYIWRGQTQTNNQPAVQGGIDYNHSSGFYSGTWLSNVDFLDSHGNQTNYEWDLYTGFGYSIKKDLSFDLNLMYIKYPDARDSDFAEISTKGTYKWLTIGVNYTFYGQADQAPGAIDNEALYIQGDIHYFTSLDFTLPYELGLSVYSGYYDFRYNDGGNDYAHWGLSLSRTVGDFGTFSFNYDQIGRDTYDQDPKLWLAWKKKF